MIAPASFSIDPSDPARLQALADYDILDTPPEQGFDDIVEIARQSCRAPVALVSLVAGDRQWFKARAGFEPCETSLDRSVCVHALAAPDLLVITDLARDPRTAANPLVTDAPHIRFYAGAPLETPSGQRIGSVCVIDTEPRPHGLDASEAATLRALARQVVAQLELRRAVRERDAMLARQRMETTRRKALVETQAAIASAKGDLDTIFDALLTGAMTAIPAAEAGTIAARDGEELVSRTARGALVGHADGRLPLEGSLAGRCCRTNEPILCGDARADTRAGQGLVGGPGLGSALFVPVLRGGETIAVLVLLSSLPFGLSALDLDVARLFAAVVTTGFAELGEASAQAEAAKLAAIVEQSTDFIGIAHPDGSIDYVNEAGRRLVGLPDAAARQSRFIDFFDPAERQAVVETVLPALGRAGSWEGELRFRHFGSGATIPVFHNIFTVRDAAGEPLGFATVTRDQSEQKKAAEALHEQQRTLRAVLDTIPVGVLFAEAPSGHIVDANRWSEEIFGRPILPSPNAEEYGDWVAFHADGRRVGPLEYPLARIIHDNRDRAELECEYQRPDGSRLWVSITAVPMRGADGTLVGAVAAIADIDARKRAEETQRLMNHELSHRMKNLLTVVQAITRQTIRGATDFGTLQRTLADRLTVLGAAHDVLLGGPAEQASMSALVRSGTGVLGEVAKEQLTIAGPELEVGGRVALQLGLMIHELSTNAVKYGALSTPAGRVDVDWAIVRGEAAERLVFSWRETGGPSVTPPLHRGFGSRLIERGVAGLAGGTVSLDFRREGLHCSVEAPLSELLPGA